MTTREATLPRSSLARPVRPRVPMTMRSAFFERAARLADSARGDPSGGMMIFQVLHRGLLVVVWDGTDPSHHSGAATEVPRRSANENGKLLARANFRVGHRRLDGTGSPREPIPEAGAGYLLIRR